MPVYFRIIFRFWENEKGAILLNCVWIFCFIWCGVELFFVCGCGFLCGCLGAVCLVFWFGFVWCVLWLFGFGFFFFNSSGLSLPF